MERIPPQKLIAEAVAPLVIKAKSPLISVIYKPAPTPIKSVTYIVTILESPGFAPTGRKGISGMRRCSRKPSTRARAPLIPRKATR